MKQTAILFLPAPAAKTATPQTRPISWDTSSVHGLRTEPALRAPVVCEHGCAHTGSTDCRKFTFRTAEGETLTFCPVCGQAENAAQLEKIDAATAWTISGSLSAADVTARTNGEYLSVAFETAGSLTQPTGRVRLALPAGLLEGKKLVRIAPDGTQTELPFEAKNGKLIFTLDFANSELPVMLFRLLPQTAAL